MTLGGILAKIASSRTTLNDLVSKPMYHFKQTEKFTEITSETELSTLSKFFERHSCALVTERVGNGKFRVCGIATKVDLLCFLTAKMN